jgi:type IV pilus assembly protein PilV
MLKRIRTVKVAPRALSRRHAAGFSLIEVMIALLIFSIGMLGLVGLQASLVRAQSGAKLRAEASYLATDLIGQMWADAANLARYGDCTSYARCNAWLNRVAQLLPNGTTTVTVTAATGLVVLMIEWQPPGDTVVHTFSTSTSVKRSQ